MTVAVRLAPAAAKDLDRLPASRRQQIIADIEKLASNPRDLSAVKQLKGFKPPLHRLRSGDYRVLFRLFPTELHVYRVIDRKELERALKRMR